MHLILGGIVFTLAVTGLGFGAKQGGEGVDQAGNGALKMAIAGAVALYAAKKAKLL